MFETETRVRRVVNSPIERHKCKSIDSDAKDGAFEITLKFPAESTNQTGPFVNTTVQIDHTVVDMRHLTQTRDGYISTFPRTSKKVPISNAKLRNLLETKEMTMEMVLHDSPNGLVAKSIEVTKISN